jgi:hypothetical protein
MSGRRLAGLHPFPIACAHDIRTLAASPQRGEARMNWKDLYVGAIRRPEAVQALLDHGLAAVQASDDASLQGKITRETATPFKMCATLDAHGVPVPLDAARHVSGDLND